MQKLWVILVVISSAIAVWFSFFAIKGLWNYSRLDAVASARIVQWQVVDMPSSEYAIEAKYLFTIKDAECSGKTKFKKPYFLNIPSAEKAVQNLQRRSWTVWYNTNQPSISTLQKVFPFEACIQAFLSIIVSVYFFFIRGFLLRVAF